MQIITVIALSAHLSRYKTDSKVDWQLGRYAYQFSPFNGKLSRKYTISFGLLASLAFYNLAFKSNRDKPKKYMDKLFKNKQMFVR